MKTKLIKLLKILLIAGISILLIYYFFLSKEAGYGRVAKGIMVLVGGLLALIKINLKPSAIILKKYENAYKDFFAGAFVNDRKSYKKLVEASIYWDRAQFDKAHKILEKLIKKCACTRDYIVVYRVKAICYARAGRNEPLIETYKIMLQYDMTNSNVWSDLGLACLGIGKTKEAEDALLKAIEYDPQNAKAYNNMAVYYMKTANPENSLQYALKAAELEPDLYQPMSAVAVAYKMLGDEENVEKYCEMYVEKGGDKEKIRMVLDAL